jgi:hypothetical protein
MKFDSKYLATCKKLGLNKKESHHLLKIAKYKKRKQFNKKAYLEKRSALNDNFIAMVLLGV